MGKLGHVGQAVKWHNPNGVEHDALLTAVWSENLVNLVVVSQDTTKTDVYGRQTERYTSCSHASVSKVHGNYWRFAEEEPNPYVPPVES